MTNVRTQHPNAALTPVSRLKMVLLVINDGWTTPIADLPSSYVRWMRAEMDELDGPTPRATSPPTRPDAEAPRRRDPLAPTGALRRSSHFLGPDRGRASPFNDPLLSEARCQCRVPVRAAGQQREQGL